jgi:site-specific recombinase XerC
MKPIKAIVGIVRTATGWRARVRVRGQLYSKCFPAETAIVVMRRWREEKRVRVRLGADLPAAGATLAQDIRAYLAQVQTMPTYRHREDDLRLWLTHFGPERTRKGIAPGEIRAQLERWIAEGYAPNTVNHRRTAIMHLWSVLDGKSAPNPAKDVPRYRVELGPPRDLSQAAIALLFDAMPESMTRAWLELFRWTGWPPAQMAKIAPDDIRWDEAVYIRARRKGKGAAGVWLPLLPQAWAALRRYKALGCWGSHSTSSARTSLRRAARRARRAIARAYASRSLDRAVARRLRTELLDVTPYQLRHSFLTLVASITRDDRAVQELGQHADIRTSHLYTGATVAPRAASALGMVTEALVAAKVPSQ